MSYEREECSANLFRCGAIIGAHTLQGGPRPVCGGFHEEPRLDTMKHTVKMWRLVRSVCNIRIHNQRTRGLKSSQMAGPGASTWE